MDREEFTDEIEKAIEMVEEAQHIVDIAINDMNIRHNYEAYGKYGFDQLLSNGNPYDRGLQDLIDRTEDDNS